nr:MAG TPA: hypothetical protein [Caudoviricetes sp.]
MNYEDIILLVKAGYTRDQIAAMQIPKQEPPAPQIPPASQEQPAPQQLPPASQEPPAQQNPPAGMAELTQLMVNEFSKLNAAITASNLAQAQQPKQESVDDIIASIINPPQKNTAEFKIKEVK